MNKYAVVDTHIGPTPERTLFDTLDAAIDFAGSLEHWDWQILGLYRGKWEEITAKERAALTSPLTYVPMR